MYGEISNKSLYSYNCSITVASFPLLKSFIIIRGPKYPLVFTYYTHGISPTIMVVTPNTEYFIFYRIFPTRIIILRLKTSGPQAGWPFISLSGIMSHKVSFMMSQSREGRLDWLGMLMWAHVTQPPLPPCPSPCPW